MIFATIWDSVGSALLQTTPVLVGLLAFYLDGLRRERKRKDDLEAAAKLKAEADAKNAALVASKVEEVKTTVAAKTVEDAVSREEIKAALEKANAEHAEKLGDLSDQVQEVHKATNGLVKKIEEAAFAKGVKSEVDKESERKPKGTA